MPAPKMQLTKADRTKIQDSESLLNNNTLGSLEENRFLITHKEHLHTILKELEGLSKHPGSLPDQLHRSLVSILSNVYEGIGRGKHSTVFLVYARGSAMEAMVQFEILDGLDSLDVEYMREVVRDLDEELHRVASLRIEQTLSRLEQD